MFGRPGPKARGGGVRYQRSPYGSSSTSQKSSERALCATAPAASVSVPPGGVLEVAHDVHEAGAVEKPASMSSRPKPSSSVATIGSPAQTPKTPGSPPDRSATRPAPGPQARQERLGKQVQPLLRAGGNQDFVWIGRDALGRLAFRHPLPQRSLELKRSCCTALRPGRSRRARRRMRLEWRRSGTTPARAFHLRAR